MARNVHVFAVLLVAERQPSDRSDNDHADGEDRRRHRRRGPERRRVSPPARIEPFPNEKSEVAAWVHDHLRLSPAMEEALLTGIATMLHQHQRMWERSKSEAITELMAGLSNRIRRLEDELAARDQKVSTITQYFEERIIELTVRANHDPKTQLINFAHFLGKLETYLAIEQRSVWCAVGLVDINSFKRVNDALGHVVGDRIIQRVARLLQEHVRSDDLLARDATQQLHARFGGDEFCFLIPNLHDPQIATGICDRFHAAVRHHAWAEEHEALAMHPITVDIGVACLQLGPVADRRRIGVQLAREVLTRADRLMYKAKNGRAVHACAETLRVQGGALVPLESGAPT